MLLSQLHGQDKLHDAQHNFNVRYLQVVNLVAFRPFKSALEALQQINAISDGLATEELLSFLELNLPKARAWSSLCMYTWHTVQLRARFKSSIRSC